MQGTCDTCGNDYHDVMEITKGEQRYTFDSFECAIAALAPECPTCGVRVVGHGVARDGATYCCEHCAGQA